MKIRKMIAAVTAVGCVLACTSCAADNPWGQIASGEDPDHIEISLPEMAEETEATELPVGTEPVQTTAEPNGETYILYTSDVHCGVDAGFGYAGLVQIRDELEAQGYQVILVDDGDFIQGAPIGAITTGEAIIDIMNAVGYDVVIPGNHEFDYGTDRFFELVQMSDFEYISCNFTHEDELVFAPYTIISEGDLDIAFVGVTTPMTISSVRPDYFQNEDGEYVYGFMEDETGEAVYEAVQNAVDEARDNGADLVYLMAHLGNNPECSPWTYSDVLSHTTGIDVCLDGHSHDNQQVVMFNDDEQDVTRSAVGYRMNCIGYSHIDADGQIIETGIWTWSNTQSAPDLLNITNEITELIDEETASFEDSLNDVIGSTSVTLTIYDPNAEDDEGNPVRVVRSAETNLGDFCADAMRDQSGADIALLTGGSVRTDVEAGDVTYGDLMNVFPFGDDLMIVEMTGQQILDALEWGARALPEENGGFLQVSGLSYEVDMSVESGCVADDNNCLQSIEGDRRVSNVMVGDDPIDEDAVYTVCIQSYVYQLGDGYTMFAESNVINNSVILDLQALINYLTDTLGGQIGEQYSDPYGLGRILINE
ncbi:MAG: bifunctional metallophosphatase/5'-nucleotidase [Saccharofermentans sp.]|nr:bifunctional metallophosphatase/5'-nucleotidase [Saccharofermentans sp.]